MGALKRHRHYFEFPTQRRFSLCQEGVAFFPSFYFLFSYIALLVNYCGKRWFLAELERCQSLMLKLSPRNDTSAYHRCVSPAKIHRCHMWTNNKMKLIECTARSSQIGWTRRTCLPLYCLSPSLYPILRRYIRHQAVSTGWVSESRGDSGLDKEHICKCVTQQSYTPTMIQQVFNKLVTLDQEMAKLESWTTF